VATVVATLGGWLAAAIAIGPQASPMPALATTFTITCAEPIHLGPFEDAEPCKVLFLRRHVLFGGATGAGKSGGLNVLMGNLAACEDVVIWAIDLKKGMELGPWAPCIDRLATTPEEATALLKDAVKILEARANHLAERGERVWEPSPDMPALVIVIVIDERARAYLITDQAVTSTAATYADYRPPLDPISQQAIN
jgi:hypothetical protein